MNEKKEIELYNFLIKLSSLTKIYRLSENKDKINEEIEKEVMEMLNYFENCNFARPNFFYKDNIPTPSIRIVLLPKYEDKYLFIKEKNEIKVINYLLPLDKDINESIKEKLKELNIENDIDFKLKLLKFRKPLENNNIYYSSYEYLLTFTLKIDKIIDGDNLIYLDINKDKFNLSKEINNLDLKEIINDLKDYKNEVLIK